MTDEEIRIAISKHLGWRFAGDAEFDEYTKNWGSADKWCAPPGTDFTKWKPEYPLVDRPHLVFTHGIPRYTECLSAMHEAFCSMDPWLQIDFSKNLLSVYRNRTGTERTGAAVVDFLHADASHWAEAFLRTLNLWKD